MTHANATRSVRLAQQTISVLGTGTTEPLRTSITEAMKTYERDVLKEVTWHL